MICATTWYKKDRFVRCLYMLYEHVSKKEKHEAEKVSTSFEESDDWEMTSGNPSMTSVGPSREA